MEKFLTFQQGQWMVHILPTKQFQTRHMSVRLLWPLDRSRLTATAVLPYLLLEGTQKYPTAKSIMRYADDLFGAVIRTGIGKRGTMQVLEASGSLPEESAIHGAEGLSQKVQELLVDLLGDPFLEGDAFPRSHVDRELTLHKKRIESVYDDKMAYAMERCVEEMGRGETFGLPRLGYVDDLQDLSGELLRQVHQQLLKEAELHVYVVGNIANPEGFAQVMFKTLSSRFGIPAAQRHSLQTVQPLDYRAGDVRHVQEQQEINQGKLNLGFRTRVSYSSPDYTALLVANGILGGFPHSKLFVNVREKASLAYYASSRLDGLTGVIAVQTGIDPRNYERALQIILQQVQALKDGQVSKEELEFTKNGLRNQYLQALDQPMSIADVHFSGVLTGTNRNIDDLLNQLQAVKADDVVEIAQTLRQDTVYFLGNRGEQDDAQG